MKQAKARITINIPHADIKVVDGSKKLLDYQLRDYKLDCDPHGLAELIVAIVVDVQKKLTR